MLYFPLIYFIGKIFQNEELGVLFSFREGGGREFGRQEGKGGEREREREREREERERERERARERERERERERGGEGR